ncbi:hypothetical protein ACFSTC_14695 [Nonomuraea ferruginea]
MRDPANRVSPRARGLWLLEALIGFVLLVGGSVLVAELGRWQRLAVGAAVVRRAAVAAAGHGGGPDHAVPAGRAVRAVRGAPVGTLR